MCKNKIILAFLLLFFWITLLGDDSGFSFENVGIEDIIYDIYEQLSEVGEYDYEELQETLMELRANPINLNEASYEDLQKLLVLNPHQIDAILLYVYQHPMESLYELRLITCLQDYIIRDILPFVIVEPQEKKEKIYFREVFKHGKHEILLQNKLSDCRSPLEDKLLTMLKYKFNYRDKILFGGTVRYASPTWLHGEYIQVNDIGFLKKMVLGNYKASYGLGLVLGDRFRFKDRVHPLNVGQFDNRWVRYNASTTDYMHGVGSTFTFHKGEVQCDVSLLYSISHPNDTLKLHTAGANFTLFFRQLQIGITTVENFYTDSVRYYFANANYNQHYFRGRRQNITGFSFRYNFGKVDIFGEAAGSQNTRYGYATTLGVRFYPQEYIGMVLMHRYFSPYYYNTWAHTFSQTTLVNDEHGLYFGADFTYYKKWNPSLYADFHKFSGYKYHVNYFPSYGFDIQLNNAWRPNSYWVIKHHLRYRLKTKTYSYASKIRIEWSMANWTLRFIGDVMLNDTTSKFPPDFSVIQDFQYAFKNTPIVLQYRFQYFHSPHWDNRIYNYENDILYAFSSPFAYGKGIRTYFNVRIKPFPFWSIYFRVRETLYTKGWSEQRNMPHRSITDVHLLFRFML